MANKVFDRHFAELLAPSQDDPDQDGVFKRFRDRYAMFLEKDCVVSITDNPLGNLAYTSPEMIDVFGLPVPKDQVEIHLNTFHRKTDDVFAPCGEQNEQDLDVLLTHAAHLGIKHILCVSGDGSDRLPRLRPEDLGYDPSVVQVVTSVELLEYIPRAYTGRFELGVAYNQYEPVEHEIEKFEKKIAAGAKFVVTQPVAMDASPDPRIDAAKESLAELTRVADREDVQVILEMWMSAKMAHLLPQCVGYDIRFGEWNPEKNLAASRNAFPGRNVYLSMVFGPKTLGNALAMVR